MCGARGACFQECGPQTHREPGCSTHTCLVQDQEGIGPEGRGAETPTPEGSLVTQGTGAVQQRNSGMGGSRQGLACGRLLQNTLQG